MDARKWNIILGSVVALGIIVFLVHAFTGGHGYRGNGAGPQSWQRGPSFHSAQQGWQGSGYQCSRSGKRHMPTIGMGGCPKMGHMGTTQGGQTCPMMKQMGEMKGTPMCPMMKQMSGMKGGTMCSGKHSMQDKGK